MVAKAPPVRNETPFPSRDEHRFEPPLLAALAVLAGWSAAQVCRDLSRRFAGMPQAWPVWLPREETQVLAWGNPIQALCFHQGVRLRQDWVRHTFIACRPGADWLRWARLAARTLLSDCATHLCWHAMSHGEARLERFWQRLGAEPERLDGSLGLRAGGTHPVWHSYRHGAPRQRVQTPSGFSVGAIDSEERVKIAKWLRMKTVREALRMPERPIELEQLDPIDGSFAWMGQVLPLSVRHRGTQVGFFLRHAWDYADDGIAELDLALPGLEQRSWRHLVEVTAAGAHHLFSRGAARIIVGTAHPAWGRVLQASGLHDVTDAVTAYGTTARYGAYFSVARSDFYASRAGKRYTACAAAPTFEEGIEPIGIAP